jgi:[ribosomal protein S5]-alanine N-acetyltransferase
MLSSDNISLRPLEETDAPAIATLANNYQIWRYVRDRLPHPYSLEDAVSFIQFTQSESRVLNFAIMYNQSLAGVTGLSLQQDIHRLNAEVGYWIGEPFWNKGIATKAVELITDYAFNTLHLHRLFAGVFHTNPASAKVLSKAGYTLECIARQAVIKEGKLLDEHRYVKLNNTPTASI